MLSERASRLRRLAALMGHGSLLLITTISAVAVLFIFLYIIRDALPFFWEKGFGFREFFARLGEFFLGTDWYPAAHPPKFGAAPLFISSIMVTLGAAVVAAPLGIAAAVCLSDVLPFTVRQFVKPIIEVLAAIPSVAYGFFALVVFTPWLQQSGGPILAIASIAVGVPFALLASLVLSELLTLHATEGRRPRARTGTFIVLLAACAYGLWELASHLWGVKIHSGTNALNASLILGVMALPTIISVSEDSLQAAGRELREGSYALGATRAETVLRVVVPAAGSGLCAAVILGVMRAVGETMVVWMASGNAAQKPEHWFDYLRPVRTVTANIAADMGEADQLKGPSGVASLRYHVLFALGLVLLAVTFLLNVVSEWAVRKTRRKLKAGT